MNNKKQKNFIQKKKSKCTKDIILILSAGCAEILRDVVNLLI